MAALGDTTPPKNPRSDGYGYNPRCIKRDISGYLVQRDATTAKIASLITGSKTIGPFQDNMQVSNGVHGAGHFTVSGDPGSGTFPSPPLYSPAGTYSLIMAFRFLYFARRSVFLATSRHD